MSSQLSFLTPFETAETMIELYGKDKIDQIPKPLGGKKKMTMFTEVDKANLSHDKDKVMLHLKDERFLWYGIVAGQVPDPVCALLTKEGESESDERKRSTQEVSNCKSLTPTPNNRNHGLA